jgi:hypothetical protein
MLLAVPKCSRLCTLRLTVAVMMTVMMRLPKKVTRSRRAGPSIASAFVGQQQKNPSAALKDPTWIMSNTFGTDNSNNLAGKYRAMSIYNSDAPSYLPFEMLHSRFRQGDTYTWVYRHKKKDGIITSWERYTVAQVDYPHIILEMASKLNDDVLEQFQTHHRMILNIEQHLQAVSSEKDWTLVAFEYYDYKDLDSTSNRDDSSSGSSSSSNGSSKSPQWHKLGQGQNVQAFEEKFNLFLMQPPHANYDTGGLSQEPATTTIIQLPITIFNCSSSASSTIIIPATITRPLRHLYTQSWYACSPDALTGIAIWKDFGDYTFALVERERNGVKQVFDVQPLSL